MKICPECGRGNQLQTWLCECGHEFDGSEPVTKDPPPMPRFPPRQRRRGDETSGWSILIAILIPVGLITGFFTVTDYSLSASCRKYVDESVPAITRSWDSRELFKRASAELEETIPEGEMAKRFSRYQAALGALVKYNGAQGSARLSVHAGGDEITAYYEAQALFERGPAAIEMGLVRRDGKWGIMFFHVKSDLVSE